MGELKLIISIPMIKKVLDYKTPEKNRWNLLMNALAGSPSTDAAESHHILQKCMISIFSEDEFKVHVGLKILETIIASQEVEHYKQFITSNLIKAIIEGQSYYSSSNPNLQEKLISTGALVCLRKFIFELFKSVDLRKELSSMVVSKILKMLVQDWIDIRSNCQVVYASWEFLGNCQLAAIPLVELLPTLVEWAGFFQIKFSNYYDQTSHSISDDKNQERRRLNLEYPVFRHFSSPYSDYKDKLGHPYIVFPRVSQHIEKYMMTNFQLIDQLPNLKSGLIEQVVKLILNHFEHYIESVATEDVTAIKETGTQKIESEESTTGEDGDEEEDEEGYMGDFSSYYETSQIAQKAPKKRRQTNNHSTLHQNHHHDSSLTSKTAQESRFPFGVPFPSGLLACLFPPTDQATLQIFDQLDDYSFLQVLSVMLNWPMFEGVGSTVQALLKDLQRRIRCCQPSIAHHARLTTFFLNNIAIPCIPRITKQLFHPPTRHGAMDALEFLLFFCNHVQTFAFDSILTFLQAAVNTLKVEILSAREEEMLNQMRKAERSGNIVLKNPAFPSVQGVVNYWDLQLCTDIQELVHIHDSIKETYFRNPVNPAEIRVDGKLPSLMVRLCRLITCQMHAHPSDSSAIQQKYQRCSILIKSVCFDSRMKSMLDHYLLKDPQGINFKPYPHCLVDQEHLMAIRSYDTLELKDLVNPNQYPLKKKQALSSSTSSAGQPTLASNQHYHPHHHHPGISNKKKGYSTSRDTSIEDDFELTAPLWAHFAAIIQQHDEYQANMKKEPKYAQWIMKKCDEWKTIKQMEKASSTTSSFVANQPPPPPPSPSILIPPITAFLSKPTLYPPAQEEPRQEEEGSQDEELNWNYPSSLSSSPHSSSRYFTPFSSTPPLPSSFNRNEVRISGEGQEESADDLFSTESLSSRRESFDSLQDQAQQQTTQHHQPTQPTSQPSSQPPKLQGRRYSLETGQKLELMLGATTNSSSSAVGHSHEVFVHKPSSLSSTGSSTQLIPVRVENRQDQEQEQPQLHPHHLVVHAGDDEQKPSLMAKNHQTEDWDSKMVKILGRTSLINFDSNCYVNASLQILFQCVDLKNSLFGMGREYSTPPARAQEAQLFMSDSNLESKQFQQEMKILGFKFQDPRYKHAIVPFPTLTNAADSVVLQCLQGLFYAMEFGTGKSLSPFELIFHMKDQFALSKQHDAMEWIQALLDRLADIAEKHRPQSLKSVDPRAAGVEKPGGEELSILTASDSEDEDIVSNDSRSSRGGHASDSEIEGDESTSRTTCTATTSASEPQVNSQFYNPINTIYGGDYMKVLKCRTCGFQWSQTETSTQLTLHFPSPLSAYSPTSPPNHSFTYASAVAGDHHHHQSHRSGSQQPVSPSGPSACTVPGSSSAPSIGINDMIKNWAKTEVLTESNGVFCKVCNQTTSTELRTYMVSPPKHLLIQLSRFVMNESGDATKICTNVTLEPHMDLPTLDLNFCHQYGTLHRLAVNKTATASSSFLLLSPSAPSSSLQSSSSEGVAKEGMTDFESTPKPSSHLKQQLTSSILSPSLSPQHKKHKLAHPSSTTSPSMSGHIFELPAGFEREFSSPSIFTNSSSSLTSTLHRQKTSTPIPTTSKASGIASGRSNETQSTYRTRGLPSHHHSFASYSPLDLPHIESQEFPEFTLESIEKKRDRNWALRSSENLGAFSGGFRSPSPPFHNPWYDPDFRLVPVGYTLYGILMHQGESVDRGHYYAFVRSSATAPLKGDTNCNSNNSLNGFNELFNAPYQKSLKSSNLFDWQDGIPSAMPFGAHPLQHVPPGHSASPDPISLHSDPTQASRSSRKSRSSHPVDQQMRELWLGFDDTNYREISWGDIVAQLSKQQNTPYALLLRRDDKNDNHVLAEAVLEPTTVGECVSSSRVPSPIPDYARIIEACKPYPPPPTFV